MVSEAPVHDWLGSQLWAGGGTSWQECLAEQSCSLHNLEAIKREWERTGVCACACVRVHNPNDGKSFYCFGRFPTKFHFPKLEFTMLPI
jgi:hypothetical protein